MKLSEEIKPRRSQNKALFHARPFKMEEPLQRLFSALIELSAITDKCVRWDESLRSVIVHPAFRSRLV